MLCLHFHKKIVANDVLDLWRAQRVRGRGGLHTLREAASTCFLSSIAAISRRDPYNTTLLSE